MAAHWVSTKRVLASMGVPVVDDLIHGFPEPAPDVKTMTIDCKVDQSYPCQGGNEGRRTYRNLEVVVNCILTLRWSLLRDQR